MKRLLLDENLPIDLRLLFSPEFEVYTVVYMGWDSYQNGQLLTVMKQNGFDALITADRNLQYQQNIIKYQVRIIVLDCASTVLNELKPFIPLVEAELRKESDAFVAVISR